jgi:hypothetical protein
MVSPVTFDEAYFTSGNYQRYMERGGSYERMALELTALSPAAMCRP